VVFAVSLFGTTVYFSQSLQQKDTQINSLTSTLETKDSQISSLQNQITNDSNTISALNTQISDLQSQITAANSQISSLNSTITSLQRQVEDLTEVVNSSESAELKTLIFHVSEKGEGYTWGRIPNVTDTYNQILALNDGMYDVLLMPEYKGYTDWAESLTWMKQNFAQIPIALPIFEGGDNNTPTRQLTINQISEAVTTLNVRELRIGEMVSWYLSRLQPFPTDYIASLLNFTRTHGLRLQWSEWKVNLGVFERVQTYIAGYEDIVTVSFQTNSKEAEPWDGFLKASGIFQHWGASIQSWYWAERGYGTTFDMPTSLMLEHALAAKKLGAEALQFEPYWYLFDNGELNDNLQTLMTVLTS
jgi:prefoldin subunit 5